MVIWVTNPIRYYSAEDLTEDDFGQVFSLLPGELVYDGRTVVGPWAIMTEAYFKVFGRGKIGRGHAQGYEGQKNGQRHKRSR